MPTIQQSDRQAFEKWLLDVHLLTGTWDYTRNCYVEFPCHLAHKAWCASAQRFGESKQSERLAVVTDEAITPSSNKTVACWHRFTQLSDGPIVRLK